MSFDAADLERLIADDLTGRAARHQLRTRRTVTPLTSTRVSIDGVEFVNFASNNYLGLTHHPRVLTAIETSLRQYGTGSGAAPLISGHTPAHASAEAAIARWKQTEDAVLLPSGYQANHAAIQTFAALGQKGGGVRFLVDKLAHASLIDAIRSTSADFRVLPHNGLAKLERLLADAPSGQMQVVVTESIFSIDGDAADLEGLVALKAKHPFLLLLDEAHGSGVYGPAGSGYAAEKGLSGHVDVSVVTLSKAFGGIGGAVCGTRSFCSALVNYGRAFIYSTAIPPYVAAGAEAAIAVCSEEPYRQACVRDLARGLRHDLMERGFAIAIGDSPIVPVIVGGEEETLALSQRLAAGRLLVPALRPPTVPKGSSRLRITLTSDHSDEDVQRLLNALVASGR